METRIESHTSTLAHAKECLTAIKTVTGVNS